MQEGRRRSVSLVRDVSAMVEDSGYSGWASTGLGIYVRNLIVCKVAFSDKKQRFILQGR